MHLLFVPLLGFGQATEMGVTAFASAGTGGAAAAGPTSLRAARHPNGVQITWVAEPGKAVGHFEVQRSADGQTFAPIGVVPAASNSSAVFTYHDAASPAAEAYYRLRLLSTKGTSTLWPSVAVPKAGAVAANPITEPVYDKMHLDLGAEALPWRLLNAKGQLLQQGTATGALDISFTRFPVGTYTLELRRGTQRESHKVVHLR
ncbi:T9SS type A sorting domain-containing protein [Hymenobacter busanensis]|uniref:T9SS type A sorting domain-containing protein n=1 Tax=Hymenobacter busanensis TaxID=2607656 RepID=A0A7L4ZSV9_9BACT|nr:T9SS type A sorting domain-containing protein [Hymenobacter busanensis]KAA9327188.1 T9SS type A sorting domain-containing protein [Hymenobacter busanensis]QHJ05855.1 hypothetical protein GUY19_00500 [Hymenobacter busanensis]